MGKYSTPVTYAHKQGKVPAQATKREYAPLNWTRVDVAAMIERHTSTKLSGKGHHTQLVGACPYPDCSVDDNGFVVWPNGSKQSTEKSMHHFYCRGCKRSGDLIKLLRDLYPDWTFTRTQVEIGMIDEEGNATQGPPASRVASEEEQRRAAWLAKQLEMLQAYYHDVQVALAKYERPQKYLLSRGISLDDALRYGLGYFPTIAETRRKADDEHVEKWAGRIIFPLSGPRSSSLTFEGRTLLLWQEGMTPEQHKRAIETYNASHEDRIERTLKTSPCGNFGYSEAIKQEHMNVCEGPFDALSLLLAGIEGVVAMGTSLSAKSIPLSIERVTLALDSDRAGNDAAKRLASGLADRGIDVATVLPGGKDWNDTHVQAGLPAIVKAFRSPVQRAEPIAAHAMKNRSADPRHENTETPQARDASEEDAAPRCSICRTSAMDVDTFRFTATGVPYCSQQCENAASVASDHDLNCDMRSVTESDTARTQDTSLEQYASVVSRVASVLGFGVTIERVDPLETMTQYLKRVYGVTGIPVAGPPEDYTSSLEPVEKRKVCPAQVLRESSDKNMISVPCSGSLAAYGWCAEHKLNAILLELGHELYYPQICIGALGIQATLAGWEAYATIASPHSLKRILPIIKRMVDQRKAESTQAA